LKCLSWIFLNAVLWEGIMRRYIRLPLKNACNVKDLGGYACRGGVTRWGAFLRGDDLHWLDKQDMGFLKEYGLKMVIDLRGKGECKNRPDAFEADKEVSYINRPFVTPAIVDADSKLDFYSEPFLMHYYIELLKSAKNAVKDIFEDFARLSEGAALFHCTHGKDRTGLIAMLLLGLAEVDRADIIANYEVTYTYVKHKTELLNFPLHILLSKRENIENAMDYLIKNYGGIQGYLKSIGLSDETLETVLGKLVE
jgi:protein-tyrosine phosphatase